MPILPSVTATRGDDGAVRYEQAALERLAREVVTRRAELGMSQEDVAAAGGPSVATLRLIEGARQPSYRPLTLGALDRALFWPPGSAAQVLAKTGTSPAGERGVAAATVRDPGERLQDFGNHVVSYWPWLLDEVRRRYGPEEAEHIVQEVVARALDRREHLDHGGNLLPWMLAMAHQVALERARQQVDVVLADREMLAALAGTVDGPDHEVLRRTKVALAELAEQDRSVLLARAEGLSYSDLAMQLGVLPPSVRQSVRRARRKLAEKFMSQRVQRDSAR